MDDRIATSLHTGLLVAVVGGVAWVTGLPALFPSLGPSAFVLATFPESEASDPRRVIGSHVLGVVAGLVSYHLFASGIVVTSEIVPFSAAGLRLAVSGAVAIVLTVTAMLQFRVRHPPACATTLIVALGLLPTFFQGTLIVAAVVVLVAVQEAILLYDGLTERVGGIVTDRSRSD
ncbi:HPP family protein [Halococcus agarilyticus]|uniref:HPP family protein n=1 Tax=Halococcus agarilyticus TaxID=1232219 RepID=UPI000677713E|nr:HPP family protein [Halococcus agarilyticus]